MDNIILKASAKSNPVDLAGAIAGQIREHGKSVINAIGAGAVNQAVKAIAIARSYVVSSGIDLVCVPSFKVLSQNESDLPEERTMIELIVETK
jgi:stage V sporulation protein S